MRGGEEDQFKVIDGWNTAPGISRHRGGVDNLVGPQMMSFLGILILFVFFFEKLSDKEDTGNVGGSGRGGFATRETTNENEMRNHERQ